jgi:hypothetical protein
MMAGHAVIQKNNRRAMRAPRVFTLMHTGDFMKKKRAYFRTGPTVPDAARPQLEGAIGRPQ